MFRGIKTHEDAIDNKVIACNCYPFIENLSWDNYHEGSTFIPTVENYKRLRGYYPAVICTGAIYRNRDNLKFCKEKGIRLSEPKLGRPPKHIAASEKRLTRQNSKKRNEVEADFGAGKGRYGLNLVMAKLQQTSETVTGMQFFLVMNLERRMRLLFVLFSKSVFHRFKALLSRLKLQLSPVGLDPVWWTPLYLEYF